MENKPETTKVDKRNKILTIVGIVLCVLFTPILIVNCIMIIQSLINPDEVPGLGGVSPMIVLTGSMEPTIKAGDIIFVKAIEAADVEIDDVISFFDPAGNGTSVVTHRVKDKKEVDGVIKFQTKGDNNSTEDRLWVSEDALIGEWTEFGIPLVGYVALFMQTPYGLIICIMVPLGLLIGYEVLRRKKEDTSKQGDMEALLQELQALKAAQAAGAAVAVDTPSEASELQTADSEPKDDVV